MSSERPVISVIIAVYHGAETLQRCLDSVAGQTYPHRELIVLDGGSTDGTVEILQNSSDKITFWASEKDRGIYHAWNKGIAQATGDWICFLGADDYFWEPDVLERLVPYLAAPKRQERIVYGKVAVVSKSGTVIRTDGKTWEEARRHIFQYLTIPHPGLLHHWDVFAEHGLFDESLKIVADYDLLLREFRQGNALYLPEITTVGMQHGGMTNNPSVMGALLGEVAQVQRKHGRSFVWRFAKVHIKTALCAVTVRVIGDRGFRTVADSFRRLTGRAPIWRLDSDKPTV